MSRPSAKGATADPRSHLSTLSPQPSGLRFPICSLNTQLSALNFSPSLNPQLSSLRPHPTLASRHESSSVKSMNAALATEISRLTPAEKLQLVEALWDELAAGEDRLPIPAWHDALLREDQARYDANPTEGASWVEVKARILGKS